MKYRVIGWMYYDNSEFEDAPTSDAAMFAIIDDIIAHNYSFSGYDHQEALYGAPILNDGKRRCFSQRSFGAIMAMAKGYYGESLFTYPLSSEGTRMPTHERAIFPDELTSEEELNESFSLTVNEAVLAGALAEGKITVADSNDLRYLDQNDSLILTAGEKSVAFTVTDVERDFGADRSRGFETLTVTLTQA